MYYLITEYIIGEIIMNHKIKKYFVSIKRDNDKDMNFSLNLDSSLTVIDALDEIRVNIDPSLSYRHSCHHGSCGTCACIINKKERLACMTFLKEFEDNKIEIEALNSFKKIKDLVVDISNMITNMEGTSYIRESEIHKDSLLPKELTEWTRFEDCIECGSCISVCPIKSNFIGPSPLASINRALEKQTNSVEIEKLKKKAYENNGVDACEKHYLCSKVCPTKVSPGKQINDLRKKRLLN